VVICLERGADLHMAKLMPVPLTVSCFSKIQIGFTFLVPAHPGSYGKRAVKLVCVCVCVCRFVISTMLCSVLNKVVGGCTVGGMVECIKCGLVSLNTCRQCCNAVISHDCCAADIKYPTRDDNIPRYSVPSD